MLAPHEEVFIMQGIYKITNTLTNGVYVGKSVFLERRFSEHMNSLSRGKHENPLLQNTYNKHGPEVFTFEVIEYTSLETIDAREIYWIKYYRENGYEVYNVADGGTGGNTWARLSEERKAEIRAKGRKPISQEARKRAADANRARWQDPEYRSSMSAKRRGRVCPPQERLIRSKIARKIPLTEEEISSLSDPRSIKRERSRWNN